MRRLPSEPEYIRERRLIREQIERDKRYFVHICSVLAVAAVCLIVLFLKTSPLIDNLRYKINDIDCEIQYVDFKYGNGIYFECEGETVLTDCGTSQHTDELLKFIESNGIKKIDFLLISEISEEYLGTLEEVLRLVDVSKVIIPECDDDSLVAMYDDLIFSKGTTFLTADKTTYFPLNKMKFDIINTRNLSLDISFGNHAFLVLNSEFVDSSVFEKGADVLILKNDDLFSGELLGMIEPENCIVNSVPYDFGELSLPKKCAIYRTDTDGDIIISSDEVSLKIKSEKQ